MASTFVNIFRVKELRKRIFFTVGMLIIFRLGTIVPVPGINIVALKEYFAPKAGDGIGLSDYLDFFVGGAFKNFSIFMLGIMPYISMTIIMQLLILVFPKLKKISEEDGGRKKIQRYNRYGTVVVCLIQSITLIRTAANPEFQSKVLSGLSYIPFSIIGVISVTAGTIFLMWIGEQISQKGIGNGVSLIIFAGIVARMPQAVQALVKQVRNDDINIVILLGVAIVYVVIVSLVIYEQQGQRKIPVNYAKRVVGRKVYQGQSSYIPFKINPSGVIPVIFASSIMMVPMQILKMVGEDGKVAGKLLTFFRYTGPAYQITYCLLIIFFAYFYTQVTLNPTEISKNIRENGGSIPGIRSDKIEKYLTKVLNRIVLPGSLFLAFIAVIPTIMSAVFGFSPQATMLMGGTSLLIMVGVALDTVSQIEGHLKMHHQDSLVKKGKIRSRNL